MIASKNAIVAGATSKTWMLVVVEPPTHLNSGSLVTGSVKNSSAQACKNCSNRSVGFEASWALIEVLRSDWAYYLIFTTVRPLFLMIQEEVGSTMRNKSHSLAYDN